MTTILIFIILFVNYFNIDTALETIELNSKNNIILRGEINEESTANIIYEISKIKNKSDLLLILDTPGGSVNHGIQIMNEVQQHNISCIALKAYSMGFAILQSCNKRYVIPSSTVMQHQISVSLGGELGKIKSYISLVSQYEYYLTDIQSKRVNVTYEDFVSKTMNDWWLFGENIIYNNVADQMVNIKCTHQLSKSNFTLTKGNYEYTYSSCPIITKEIDKQKNKNSNDYSIFYI